MAAPRRSTRLSAGELKILEMLWREDGVTILEAQRALGLPIGYTTVQTRLNRLVKKRLATKTRTRPARYRAAITPQHVCADDLDTLVRRVSEGKVVPLVAQLVTSRSLTPEEIGELKQLIAQAEKRVKSPRATGGEK